MGCSIEKNIHGIPTLVRNLHTGEESKLYKSIIEVPFIENGEEAIDIFTQATSLEFIEKGVEMQEGEPKLFYLAGNSSGKTIYDNFRDATGENNRPVHIGFIKSGSIKEFNGRKSVDMEDVIMLTSYSGKLSYGKTKADKISNLIATGVINGEKKAYNVDFSKLYPQVKQSVAAQKETAKLVSEYLISKGLPINILSESQMIEEARKLGYENFNAMADVWSVENNYKVIDDLDSSSTIALEFKDGRVVIGEVFGLDESMEQFDERFSNSEFFIEIQDLRVNEDSQGLGLGGSLLRDSINYIQQKYGNVDIYLNASPIYNKKMDVKELSSFYAKYGFNELKNEGTNVEMLKKGGSDIKFLKNKNERIYGFYNPSNNQIYLTEEVLSSENLVHELYHYFKPILKDRALNGDVSAKAVLEKMRVAALEFLGGAESIEKRYDSSDKTNDSSLNYSINNIELVKDENGNLLAPNGKTSNLNETQWRIARSPEFKSWSNNWENSIKDDNGEPQVLYSGSNALFTEFDREYIGSNVGTSEGRGFYFSSNKKIADGYAEKGKVYEVFVNIEKNISYEKKTLTKSQIKKIISNLENKGVDVLSNWGDITFDGRDKVLSDAVNAYFDNDNDVDIINSLFNDVGANFELYDELISIGYKGTEIKNADWGGDLGGQKIVVAFAANQIKLADGSNVTFGETADIRFMTDRLSSDAYSPRQNESKEQYLDRIIEEAEAILLQENSIEYFERIAVQMGLNKSETKSFIQKVKQFIKEFSSWIANQLGIDNVTPEQLDEMTQKELFDRITTSMISGNYLSENTNNYLSLQSKLNYAKDVYEGLSNLERLSPKEERGRIEGGRRNVEATIIAGTSKGTDQEGQRSISEAERQEIALEEYAREENIWFDDYDTKFGGYLDIGGEAVVYYDGKIVTKVNDLPHNETPLSFFDRIALHNVLFPESKYTLVGFTKRKDTGNFSIIVQQPFVEQGRLLQPIAIKREMLKMGYTRIDDVSYKNDRYIIDDLHSKNIWEAPNRELVFIDPIISINTQDQGYGGQQVLGEISIKPNNDIQFSVASDQIAAKKKELTKAKQNLQKFEDNLAKNTVKQASLLDDTVQQNLLEIDKDEVRKQFSELRAEINRITQEIATLNAKQESQINPNQLTLFDSTIIVEETTEEQKFLEAIQSNPESIVDILIQNGEVTQNCTI